MVGPAGGPVGFGVNSAEEVDFFEEGVALDLFGSRECGGTSFGSDIRVSVVERIHKARSPAPLGAG